MANPKLAFSVFLGLSSAILFGLATPASKILLEQLTPPQLAGLLYLGVSLGLLPGMLKAPWKAPKSIERRSWLRLAGAVCFGGVIGPLLLLFGLRLSTAGSVSLILNLEVAATAILGVTFFKEHLHRSGILGVAGIFAAGALVSTGGGWPGIAAGTLVALACLCWALDNHWTALVDGFTPAQITFCKGLVAGSVNFTLGLALAPLTAKPIFIGAALLVGSVSYGMSIVLYIKSAQGLGPTRAQGLFAAAPFIGAGLSFLALHEPLQTAQVLGAALLALSVAALFATRHEHAHQHEALDHIHEHTHDDGHHLHQHPGLEPSTRHTHWHSHDAIHHSHPHVPDLHHRHSH